MTVALRIGLVTEGPTDQIVLQHLLRAYCGEQVDVTFVPLQPNGDRTSAGAAGGWEKIYGWCLNNEPAVREEHYFGDGLFAGGLDAQRCDVILVQMDADVCDARRITDKSPVRPLPTSESPPEERGAFIRDTILAWLWPNDAVADHRHIPAPAVEAIETWLVAGLCDDAESETMASNAVLRRLVELDFERRGATCPATAKKVAKTERNYERLSRLAAPNAQAIAERCGHFRSLMDALLLPLLVSEEGA